MQFNGLQRLLVAGAALALSACSMVQYKPISVDNTFWQTREKSIAVVATNVPEPEHHMLGQQGLLDLAINMAAASSLREKLKKLDTSRANLIDKNLAQRLGARGFKVTPVEQRLDRTKLVKFDAPKPAEQYSPYDFRSYKTQGYDYVLFITVNQIGTQRSYYGFLPLGAPLATFSAVGQLVDTRDNKLVWYGSESSVVPIPDPWDQSPDFANAMTTVTKNMEESAVRLERSLFATSVTPALPAPSSPVSSVTSGAPAAPSATTAK